MTASQINSGSNDLIPVFPLNSVLFPGGLLPLKIFEARYLDMVSRCLRDDSGFVVAAIRSGQEVGGDAEIHPMGTLAKIADWDRLQNGLLGITAEGQQKVTILATEVAQDHLLLAQVKNMTPESSEVLPLEFTELAGLLEKILRDIGAPFDRYEPELDNAVWVAGRLTELLPMSIQSKQKLLEIPDALSRLHLLQDVMKGMDIL